MTTRYGVLGVARLFFRCLCERGLVLVNPMRGVTGPERGPERIRVHLSEEEVARFLDGIDTDAPFGLRDRALFELIYSSALRAGEASGLCVGDVDLERRLIRVRESKYSKDRVVPMTELAAERLADLIHGRSVDRPVFRGSGGKRVSGTTINHHFKTLMKRAGLYREGLSSMRLGTPARRTCWPTEPIFATSRAFWGISPSRRPCGIRTSSWRTSGAVTCEATRGRTSRGGRSMRPINRALALLWGSLRRLRRNESSGRVEVRQPGLI